VKNKLPALQAHLFEMIETLKDPKLKGDSLKQEIERALAVNELARTAVANGALMAKCADILYGIPVSDDVPLIPKAAGETFLVDGKRKALLALPKSAAEREGRRRLG
jgi:hypothetical protein